MTREQVEFLVSQYVDGNLPAGEVTALEAELARDEEAREVLASYRVLNEMLRTQMPGVGDVDWEGFASATSKMIAEEEVPALTYRMPMLTWGRMAIAASVLLVGAIGILVYHQGTARPVTPAAPQGIARVQGPSTEAATQPAVAQISVGPATEVAETQYPLDGVVFQPSQVSLIATPDDSGDDNRRSLYQR